MFYFFFRREGREERREEGGEEEGGIRRGRWRYGLRSIRLSFFFICFERKFVFNQNKEKKLEYNSLFSLYI